MGMKARPKKLVTLMARITDVGDVAGWPLDANGRPQWVQVKGELDEEDQVWESAGWSLVPGPDGRVPPSAIPQLKDSFEDAYAEDSDEECGDDEECELVTVPAFGWRVDR